MQSCATRSCGDLGLPRCAKYAGEPATTTGSSSVTRGDDVGQRLVEGQVQRNFRVLREKSQNSGAQKKIAGWRWRRDAQHAGRLAAELIRRFQRRLILVKHRPMPLQKTFAGCSWGNRSCRPL